MTNLMARSFIDLLDSDTPGICQSFIGPELCDQLCRELKISWVESSSLFAEKKIA
jgi:hypothetical protein